MIKKKPDEEEVILEDNEDEKPQETDGIEIPLDENDDPFSAEELKKQEEEQKAKEEEQRKKNAEFAQRRLDQEKAKLRQELEESKKRVADLERKSVTSSQPHNNTYTEKDKSYWEKRLAEDPVGALDEYEDYKYNKRMEKQKQEYERQQLLGNWQNTLNESQQMAIHEFPSLDVEGSPEQEMFVDILNKHPEWRQSAIGPLKVVNEMKKLRANENGGKDFISKARADAETNERNRQARITSQPLSSSRPNINSNKVVLSKEHMQMWKDNFKDRGITLEKYAQMVKRNQGDGGIQI